MTRVTVADVLGWTPNVVSLTHLEERRGWLGHSGAGGEELPEGAWPRDEPTAEEERAAA